MYSNRATLEGRKMKVHMGGKTGVACTQEDSNTKHPHRRSKARDRAPSTVMMTKKLSRATRPGDVVTSTAVLGGLHHEYKLDHLAAYHRREFLRRTQIPATHCVILRFAK